MSKRKRGRVAKAQASSKVRPKTARGGEHSRRANSKQARVLRLLRRPSGATIATIATCTGSQLREGGATLCMTIAGLRTCERPTAWLGWEDSNSEMSPQIIPLKDHTDCGDPAEFWLWSLFAFELRRWRYAARA